MTLREKEKISPDSEFVGNDLQDVIRDTATGEISELAVVAEGEERTTMFVWILVMCSTISGLLFGALSASQSAYASTK